jgi:ABC-type antimicrobial peptide transport system permease subunit
MIPTLRRVLAELDPDVPAYDIGTLEDQVARQTWVQRIARDILTAFAATAAFLAVIGLYGVISYAVLRRRHELGIRLALGATPRRVRRLVVRQGLTLGLTGITLGWLVALAAVRLLDTLLFEVEPGDVATFVAAPLVVLVLAVLATWLPARRAAALDPVRALRNE